MSMLTNIILELAIGGIVETAFIAKLPKAYRYSLLTIIFVVLIALTAFFAYMSWALLDNLTVSIVCAVTALICCLYIVSLIGKIRKTKGEKQSI